MPLKINIHTSHPSVFISSTFIDLEEERKAVAEVLINSNLNINALDVKPASNDRSAKEILTGIRESDFIILIIGERYGSIIKEMTSSPELSITRWEYIKAVRILRKDVLVYFKKVNSDHPMYYDDRNASDYQMKRILLKKFKQELSSRHNPKYFSTSEELAREVKNALIPTYRSGIRTLLSRQENLLRQIDELKQENQRLKTIQSNCRSTGRLMDLARSSEEYSLRGIIGDTNKTEGITSFGLGLIPTLGGLNGK